MIRTFKASGTILYGRAMMAQLASEMSHLRVKNPVIVTEQKFRRKALKAAALFNSGHFGSVRLVEGEAPEDSDFLILAGGNVLSDHYDTDKRYKARIPLHVSHLLEIREPVSDYLVIDSSLIKNKARISDFFKSMAYSISDGMIETPIDHSLPKAFSYSCKTAVLSGSSSLGELPRLLNLKKVARPLLLTDKGIIAAGLLKYISDELDYITPVLFSEIPPDSNIDVVNRISSLYHKEKCDAIISFGGGSVLDTGKGVYLNVSMASSDIQTMAGSGHIPRLNIPFYAVPTTSGTGSEVTKVAVISDPAGMRKLLFNSTNLQPDYALLDSRLTLTLPPHLTSITGMDALTHAVEAYTCLGKNPLSDQMAWTAIELIQKHLIPSVQNPGDIEHRQALAIASNMAGQAFSNSMVGMVHTIGHSVGAVCHAAHGSCMSVLLPHGLEYNFIKIESLLSELLLAFAGKKTFDETAEEDRAGLTISIIRRMNRDLKEMTGGRHPELLSDLRNREGQPLVLREHFPRIAETSLGDASIVYNPVELRFDDIMGVLERSY